MSVKRKKILVLVCCPECGHYCECAVDRIWDVYRKGAGVGQIICSQCTYFGTRQTAWLGDAALNFTVRGERFWAFNLSHLLSIRSYLESVNRNQFGCESYWGYFHRKLPKGIIRGKSRAEAIRKINRTLAEFARPAN